MHLHPVVQATKQGLGGREPPDALQHLDRLGMQLRHRHSFFPRSSGRPLASMAAMPSLGSRRWLRYGIVAVAVLLVLAGGAVAFVLAHSPHNISHPNVEFTEPATTTPPAAPAKKVDTFSWPRYGFDAARTAPSLRLMRRSRPCASGGASRTSPCSSSHRSSTRTGCIWSTTTARPRRSTRARVTSCGRPRSGRWRPPPPPWGSSRGSSTSRCSRTTGSLPATVASRRSR